MTNVIKMLHGIAKGDTFRECAIDNIHKPNFLDTGGKYTSQPLLWKNSFHCRDTFIPKYSPTPDSWQRMADDLYGFPCWLRGLQLTPTHLSALPCGAPFGAIRNVFTSYACSYFISLPQVTMNDYFNHTLFILSNLMLWEHCYPEEVGITIKKLKGDLLEIEEMEDPDMRYLQYALKLLYKPDNYVDFCKGIYLLVPKNHIPQYLLDCIECLHKMMRASDELSEAKAELKI